MRAGGPRQASLDHTQYSVYYAVVTQNKDPDKLGRIKVRLPWLDQGDTDQTSWAQTVTPMEGPKFGWYALPDIDDVVAVMFIQGDIHQPVVLGGIWSKPDFSPEPNEDGKNNFRGYRSRSGHRLILDDSGKTKVVIADKTGKNTIGIGNFDKEGAGPNVCAVFKPPEAGTTGISFSTQEGKIELTCKDGALTITAEKMVKFNILETFDLKAGQALTFEGSSALKVTSASPANYDAPKMNIQ